MKTQTTFAAKAKRIVAKYPNHKNSKLDHEEMMEELAGLQKEQQAAKELRESNQHNQLAKGGYTDANLFAEGTPSKPKADMTLTKEDQTAIEQLMLYKQAVVSKEKIDGFGGTTAKFTQEQREAVSNALAAGPFAKGTNVNKLMKKIGASNLSVEDKGLIQEFATYYGDKKNLGTMPDSTREKFNKWESSNATAEDPDLITLSTDEESAVVQTIQQTAEEDESISFLEPSTSTQSFDMTRQDGPRVGGEIGERIDPSTSTTSVDMTRQDGPRATPITPEVDPNANFKARDFVPTAGEYVEGVPVQNSGTPAVKTGEDEDKDKNKFDSWWMAPTLASGVAPILTNLANRKNVGNAERVDPTPYTPSIKPTWYDNQPIKDALSDSLASNRYALTERGGNSADYLTALRTLNQDNMRQLGLAEVEGQKMNQQEQARIDQLVSGSKKYNAGMETQADNDKYGTQLTMDQLKRDYLTGASDAASGVFADTSDAMLAEKLGKLKGYYTTLNSQVTTT